MLRGRLDLLTKRFVLDGASVQIIGDFDPFIRFVASTGTGAGTARAALVCSLKKTNRWTIPDVGRSYTFLSLLRAESCIFNELGALKSQPSKKDIHA